MAKPKATPRPKILEPLAIEAGAKAANEIKGLPAARQLEANPQRRAQAQAAAAELQDVARRPSEILKALGARGILQDPASALGPAMGAMPQAPARYVLATPEVTAWVLSTLEKKGLIKDKTLRLGSLRIDPRAGVVLLSEALAYSAPRTVAGAGRRVNTRGGVFYEMLMPFHEKVVVEETRVACQEAERILRARGQAAGLGAAQIDAQVNAARETITARMAGMSGVAIDGPLSTGADGVALMDSGRVAEGLWMIRMNTMRDVNGKLVADHFRALASFEKDVTRLVPIGLGESKFQSGAGKIVPQMIETVARVSDGVTAANLPRTGKVEVQWGSEVIAVIQSEEAPPPSHFEDLAQKLAAEAGSSSVKATPITMVNKQGADDAREIVKAVLDELRARSAQTKKPPKP